MAIDLNVKPYWDDYDEEKQFYKILARERTGLQIREVNQIQSILQKQIERGNKHFFEDGAMIIPGQISHDTRVPWIKLVATTNLLDETWRENNLQGQIIRGSSGIEAKVMLHLNDAGTPVLFVKYLKGDPSTGELSTFADDEVLTVLDADGDETAIQLVMIGSSSSGLGSTASIQSGVYFIRGLMVLVLEQTIILEAYSDSPSKRVGLLVTESIVTSDDDASLYDNAQGNPNYTAPGNDRLKIDLVLTALELNTLGTTDNDNFIELLRVQDGALLKKVDTTDYSIFETTLARRTYLESGDYTKSPFHIDVVEFYNDGSNGGKYVPADFEYGTPAEAKQVAMDRFGVASPGTSHLAGSVYRPGSSASNLIALMQAKLVVIVEPGIAFVRGYEIKKIAKSFIDLNKARDTAFVNNGSVHCQLGNYIRISNVYSLPDVATYGAVSLRDTPNATPGSAPGAEIGTARIRAIEYETGTINTAAAIYRLYLFDVRMNAGKEAYQIKSLYASAPTPDFTADIVLDEMLMSGTITAATSVNVVGVGTVWVSDDRERLAVGDWIRVATGYHKIDTITDDNNLVLSGSATFAAANFYLVYATIYEQYNAGLLFPLPQNVIRQVKDESGDIETNYLVHRQFATQLVNSSGEITLSCGADEEFLNFSTSNYIAMYTAGTYIGDFIALTSSNVVLGGSPVGSQVTINGLAHALSDSVQVVASVRKIQGTASGQKSKTLVSDSTVITADNLEDLNEVSLVKADVIVVSAIYMSTGFTVTPTTAHENITDRYELDNGQRDSYYGMAKIVRKPGTNKPTGKLLVVFDYYSHSANGNYFSVDSYTAVPAGTAYEDIPEYSSKESGWVYRLRDCLDFRPRINDAGTGFTGTGSSTSEVPKDQVVYADYSHYLHRIDKLMLDSKGDFHIIEGVSGIYPKSPEDSDEGMTTHKLSIRAYTLGSQEVFREYIENKGFTMRDIGKIEKRVENLEYYVSLQLLEKETESFLIKDANGLDRFKNGFIVDPFTGSGIGDVLSPEYKCAIDMEEQEMRPMFVEDIVNIIEDPEVTGDTNPDTERTVRGYQLTGDLFTLPYTSVPMISQPMMSNVINVNPFAVINFLGKIDLNPPLDEWKDTKRAPDLIVNQEGNYDAIKELADGMSTVWNEWETTWTGSTSTTDTSVIREYNTTQSLQHRDMDGSLTPADRGGSFSRPGVDQWPVRDVTITRTTTVVNTRQSRTGLRAKVVPKVVKQSFGDKVINVAYIPYIRTRDVQFRASGLKPTTKVWPFFDGILVDHYISTWDDPEVVEAFNGSDRADTGTKLVTDVRGKVSGTFRIPNADSIKFKTGDRLFEVIDSATNDKGNFRTAAAATYRAQGIMETKQETIVSTRNAEVTMERVIDERVLSNSSVDTTYQYGIWIDPVAQSFLVTEPGGAFIVGVDLYFSSRDNFIPIQIQIREMVNGYPGPHILPFGEILVEPHSRARTSSDSGALTVGETITGADSGATAKVWSYETGIVGFDQVNGLDFTVGETITGSSSHKTSVIDSVSYGVNTNQIVNGELVVNGGTAQASFDATDFMPTRVVFSSPIYVRPASEQALVVMANSTKYNIWIATMGQAMVGTEIPVQEQPYTGSFFKSQNSSTWDADQYSDLAFILRKAAFTTNTAGDLIFMNDELPTALLDQNPFATTLNSKKVRVTHRNHGMPTGSSVVISGAEGSTDLVNGIPITELNTTHVISGVELDSYIITVATTVATSTGAGGAESVYATENKQMDVVHPSVGQLTFPGTRITYGIKTCSGKSVHGAQTPYIIDSDYSNFIPNQNITFDSPRLVASATNESASALAGDKSFIVRATMSTTDADLSPVIDLQKLSLIAVGNRLDDPAATGTNAVDDADIDKITLVSANTHVGFAVTTNIINSTDSATSKALSQIQVGKFITVTGSSVSGNNTTYRVTAVSYSSPNISITVDFALGTDAAGDAVTVVLLNRFVDERAASGGITSAKYLCRRMMLANPATALHIMIAACVQEESEFDMYYKLLRADDTQTAMDSLAWNLIEGPDTEIAASTSDGDFRDYEFTVNSLPEFVGVAAKIVARGSNSAKVPRFQDFRMTALGT